MEQAMHISQLLQSATVEFRHGKLIEHFWTLVSIRRLINYDLKEKERTEMNALEYKASRFINYANEDEDTENKAMKFRFAMIAGEYQARVMDLLKKLGFFPNKEDRTRLGF